MNAEEYIRYKKSVAFLKPIDGDVVNSFDGVIENGLLLIDFFIQADKFFEVKVNGRKADFVDGLYKIKLPVEYGENVFKAECRGEIDTITIIRTEKSVGKYRLSSDDNILFLENLNKNKNAFNSIFEDPYLAVYKKAHDLYDAKVHLNIYYSLIEHPNFSNKRDYFDISMMTDKFKDEWIDNSDWLKLNFHANADLPCNPYKDASYEEVYRDCERVMNEIRRFAGENTLSKETTIHFGDLNEDGLRALRELGIRVLAGYFKIEGANALVSYNYPKSLVSHIECRDFWYDKRADMYFAKIDNVLNLHTREEIEGLLSVLMTDKTRSGFIEIMMHEEFFYKDYKYYSPDFEEKILNACRLIYNKGYKGSFLSSALPLKK